MNLRIGDVVDDFTFLRADGSPITLSAFTDKGLVLIFLRHLA
jgi:peroxiredoxin